MSNVALFPFFGVHGRRKGEKLHFRDVTGQSEEIWPEKLCHDVNIAHVEALDLRGPAQVDVVLMLTV